MAQTKVKLISDGVIDVNHLASGHSITTDNIGEGSNLYYTDARVSTYLSTNNYATEGYVTTAVANLVDSAPTTLDTLNELAAALGDDPNFATTVTNSIATKLPLAGGTLTGSLGIGISPSATLDVRRSDTSGLIAEFHQSTGYGIDVGSSESEGYISTGYLQDFIFKTNAGSGQVERLRIDSSGLVEIKKSDNARLAVRQTDSSAFGKYAQVTLSHGSTYFGANDKTYQLVSNGQVDGEANFAIQYWNGSSYQERIRVTSGGDVGIGDSTPNFVTSGRRVLELNGSSEALMSFAVNGTWQYYIHALTSGIYHATGGKDFVIDPGSSNVGIGTTLPDEKLHVNGNIASINSSYPTIKVQGSDVNYQGRMRWDTNNNVLEFLTRHAGTYYGDTLVLKEGKIGIGTNSPSTSLHTYKNSTDAYNIFESSTNKWVFGEAGGICQVAGLYGVHSGINVNTSGNVGIGTTSPATKLQVNGPIGMRDGSGEPKNVRFVKTGTSSVSFNISVGATGAWRAGHAFLKVSGAQNGLQEHHSAWYHLKLVHYYLSGVTQSGTSNPALIKDSGGDTGNYTLSVTSTGSSNPQVITITISDANGSTDSMIADIDATFFQGIQGIS